MTYPTTYVVKFLGPTNHRGPRFIVTHGHTGERRTVSFNYAASSPIHQAVVEAFPMPGTPRTIVYSGHSGRNVNYFTETIN